MRTPVCYYMFMNSSPFHCTYCVPLLYIYIYIHIQYIYIYIYNMYNIYIYIYIYIYNTQHIYKR